MKIILSVFATLLLVGCKPAEKGAEGPKARYEPRTAVTTESTETTPAKALVTPEERQTQYNALESDLGVLERDVAALRTRAEAKTKDAAITEEIRALSARVETVRSELLAAQQLDGNAWPARRDKLSAELMSYRNEFDTVSKKVSP